MGTTKVFSPQDILPKPSPETLVMLERIAFGAVVIGSVAALASGIASAGGDSTFNAPVTWLNNALTGSLGRTIALASLAAGLGIGVVKQSVMSVVVGTAIALSASVGPGVLTGILGAAL
jgi:conjugal transfer pilus assembly protein TraA